MSTTLTNASYINTFDEKLKSYNNIFFKTLQDGGLLNETTDIKNDANALNIGDTNSYSTDQFNNFIRNIINFKIKNYTDLSATGTNLEFVNRSVNGSTATYTFNNDVRDNIIDTLKILNVFVDILDAYKYCIDNTGKEGATFDTCYYDDINIERIEVVSSTTRIYASSAPVPDINTYKNVGYIRNTKTSASATPNNVLYLSIQSFHTGLSDAKNNYNDIFNKTFISGTYNSRTENSTPVSATIFDASVTNIADPKSTEIAKKDYAMHYYDKTITINKSGLTRDERNKNVVSLLLKCLFYIDPKYRKQSVYALYYYYKFVQLYATLIINISNVMYANVSDSANPIRIDSYNTGTEISVTAIEVVTKGVGYVNSSQNTLRIQNGGLAATQATAKANANAQGDIITGSSAINIITNGSGYTSAPTVDFSTTLHTKKSDAVTANTAASTGATGADAAYTAASDTYYAAVNAVNTEIFKLSSSSLTTEINRLLRTSINTSLTIANYAGSTDATTLATAKTAASITTTTFDAYINALIAERKAYLSGTPLNSDNINTEILKLSSSSLTNTIDKSLRKSIVSQLTSANYEDAGTIKSDAPADATIKTTAKTAAAITTTTTFDAYINALIAERKAYLILEKKLILKNTAADALQTANALPTDVAATFKATIVPLAYQNTTKTQIENIDRFKNVFDDIETKIGALTTIIKDAADPASEESFVIVKSGTSAKIKAGSTNNVVIMIPKTDLVIYNKLIKYNDINNLVNDCSIYDKQNKKYYDILKISIFTSSSVEYFGIEINAVFVKDPTKEYVGLFYKYDATLYTSIPASETAISASGEFLEIRRKDINALKNNYIENKKAVDELNANISLNTNRVNNQKNLYETQYNKNVFLSRQILTYNILICTIIVVLIGINVFKIDKPLVKSISLACLGIIILLFIIYFMSNITYIETFAVDDANITKLKDTSTALTTRNTNKVGVLKTEIDKLNAQFIRYFETIMIKLPTADSHDFYREISSVINADIENKTYLDKILDFNSSQGNTNMDTLKYELENNKLYILTLLISSIIFIGLYNIYINYINDDKYLSLMIFIAIIIFIVIGAYYIINSNRRVRTIHKNIYWGPQSSESF
uniref:Uncharacterized protein n=1 Tax=viral metagenome TaxID=1070528 RepID=A0A6C0I9D6_9ZZZZ